NPQPMPICPHDHGPPDGDGAAAPLSHSRRFAHEPALNATRGLWGESPSFGRSTTTGAPTFTRLYRSMTSSLVKRMQPDEMVGRLYPGGVVRGPRNRVSLRPWSRYIARAPIGLCGPPVTWSGTSPIRFLISAVGVQDGHSSMRPTLATPDHASASS